jgi:hypothetical protein
MGLEKNLVESYVAMMDSEYADVAGVIQNVNFNCGLITGYKRAGLNDEQASSNLIEYLREVHKESPGKIVRSTLKNQLSLVELGLSSFSLLEETGVILPKGIMENYNLLKDAYMQILEK